MMIAKLRGEQLERNRSEMPENIKLRKGGFLFIGNQAYRILGLLGESTSDVLLGETIDHRKVVIKIPSMDTRAELREHSHLPLLAEYRLTQYLQSRGYAVPKILFFEAGKSILIKEYIEGLSFEEIEKKQLELGLTPRDVSHLKKSLIFKHRNYILKLRPSYLAWLKNQSTEDYQILKDLEPHTVFRDSMTLENFIFTAERGWQLFDP